MKLSRILLTGALSVSMIVTGAVCAFADDTDVTKVSEDAGATVSKEMTMASKGVTNPNVTFKFIVEPQNNAPAITRVITVNSTDAANVEKSTDAIFQDGDFSNVVPGIYEYTITEDKSVFKNDADHVMNFDDTVYKVRVKVVNDGTTEKNKIAGITAAPVTIVVDSETGEETETVGAKTNKISFTNKYTEMANDDPDNPENPNDNPADSSKGLVISKDIKGEGANMKEKFRFKITFKADPNNVDAKGDLLPVTVGDKTIAYDQEYSFELGDDGKIEFKLPAGTTYKVVETNNEYTATASKIENGGAAQEVKDSTVEGYVGEKSNTIAFTNTKEAPDITGLVMNNAPYVALIALALAMAAAYIMIRRRKAGEME